MATGIGGPAPAGAEAVRLGDNLASVIVDGQASRALFSLDNEPEEFPTQNEQQYK
jgi:hypothetical protein